mgnify:CR=1 FL=1
MNEHFPYVYEQGHWIKDTEPETVTLRGIIETALGFALMAAVLVLVMMVWLCM